MDKELPFFKFSPSEWLVGKITFQPLDVQGAFIQCCCMYWKLNGILRIKDIDFRIGKDKLDTLIEYGFVSEKEGFLNITFLFNQLQHFNSIREVRSQNGSKGGVAKANNSIANANQNIADIRYKNKDIRIKTVKENDIKERKLKFASTLEPFLAKFNKKMLNDFYLYWTEENKSHTKFRQELEKTWSLERRLDTWANNENNFKKEKGSAEKEKNPMFGRMSEQDIKDSLADW